MNISEAPIFPLLKGKVAIITEGAQGMGKTTAAAFLNSDEVENLITPLMEFDEKRWRRSMDATLTRTALCLKYEMQQMKRQGSKVSIVSIASVNTFLAVPYMPAYTSAKHALIGLTKHASNKGGPLGRSDFFDMSAACLKVIGITPEEFAVNVNQFKQVRKET